MNITIEKNMENHKTDLNFKIKSVRKQKIIKIISKKTKIRNTLQQKKIQIRFESFLFDLCD